MRPLDRFEMALEGFDGGRRQNGWPILLTLAAPNDNLPPLEIDVFHAKLKAFLQPQSRAVEKSDALVYDLWSSWSTRARCSPV